MPGELAGGLLLLLLAHFTAASIWDLRSRRIPDLLTASMAGGGLAVAAFGVSPVGIGPGLSALSAVVVFILFTGLRRLAGALDPRATIGGGDIKLLAATAAWTGLPCIVLASIIASAILLLVALVRGMGRHDRLPFAPAFAIAVSVLLAIAP